MEDAIAGVDAAKAAGMRVIGTGDAAFYEKADWHVQAFDEILNLSL